MNNRVNLDKKLLNKKEKTEIKNFLKKKKVNLKKNFKNANIKLQKQTIFEQNDSPSLMSKQVD